MKPIVIARTAAIAAVVVLAGIGCNAASDQSPTAEAEIPSLPATQSLEDRITATDLAMAGVVLREFPTVVKPPAPAMDSTPAPDLEGRAISAVPTPGAVDDQGNLKQPEPGDPLIDFTLPRAGGGEITLSEIGRDRYTVLVFYRAFW